MTESTIINTNSGGCLSRLFPPARRACFDFCEEQTEESSSSLSSHHSRELQQEQPQRLAPVSPLPTPLQVPTSTSPSTSSSIHTTNAETSIISTKAKPKHHYDNNSNNDKRSSKEQQGGDGAPPTSQQSFLLLEIVGATNLSSLTTAATTMMNTDDDGDSYRATTSTTSKESAASKKKKEGKDDDISSYVRVECEKAMAHCTKTISSNANPIWTIQTKSLCVLRMNLPQQSATTTTTAATNSTTTSGSATNHAASKAAATTSSSVEAKKKKNTAAAAVQFIVVCHSSATGKKHVGTVSLTLEQVLRLAQREGGGGQRTEFAIRKVDNTTREEQRDLKDEEQQAAAQVARLAIRIRPASAHDLDFMEIVTTTIDKAIGNAIMAVAATYGEGLFFAQPHSSSPKRLAAGGEYCTEDDTEPGGTDSSGIPPPLRGCPTDLEFGEVKFRSVFKSYRKKITSPNDPTGKTKVEAFRVSVPTTVPHGKRQARGDGSQHQQSPPPPPPPPHQDDSSSSPTQGVSSKVSPATKESATAAGSTTSSQAPPTERSERVGMEQRWLTQQDLDDLSTRPSQNWVNVGSGTIGKVYVEILGCDDLPQMDEIQAAATHLPLNWNIETDPFCALVMEDNLVRTDMMWDNALHPRWMPWTMRAFCFNVQHPATALLRVAVFDYDQQLTNPLDSHDPIGRVAIDITSEGFLPDTNYVMTYRLQHDLSSSPTTPPPTTPQSADIATRPLKHANHPDRGTITIRLRVEWMDEKQARRMILYTQPPRFVINCQTKQAQRVLRYVTRGPVDLEQPSVESIKLYVQEIKSFWKRYCVFLDILFETLLWRGRWYWNSTVAEDIHHSRSVCFPISSIVLFMAVALAIERPHLIPTIFLYSIAWIMLTIRYHASFHPYPWKRLRRPVFLEIKARRNRDNVDSQDVRIAPYQGFEQGRLYDKLAEVRGERMAALLTATLSFLSEASSIFSSASIDGHEFYSTASKVNWKTWVVGSGRLAPVHSMLKSICVLGRQYLSLINWKSYHLANKLTISCLLIGTLWSLSPVRTVALWTLRIVVWSLLGPWMKLVDLVWVRSWYDTTDALFAHIILAEDNVHKDTDSVRSGHDISSTALLEPNLPDFKALLEHDFFQQRAHKGRIVQEENVKLRAMREYVFGQYGEFIPATDAAASRFPSVPLPSSHAEPIAPNRNKASSAAFYAPGQKLTGNMIMKLDSEEHGVVGKRREEGARTAQSKNKTE